MNAMHFKAARLALALAGAFSAGGASAFDQIPLTLDEAQSAAEADRANAIRMGGEVSAANGSSTAAAKSWNGYGKAEGGADVDVNLSGGTAAEGWRLSGDNLGSPIPRLQAEYQKAGKYALEGEAKRIRHVAAEDANVMGGKADLETIRDVYRVGARWLPADNVDTRIGYQADHRQGTSSVLLRHNYTSYGNHAYELDDTHHQAAASIEYIGSGWRASTGYELSKFENDAGPLLYFVNNAQGQPTIAGRAIDPSNTLHRVKADASFDIGQTSRLDVAAGYAWSQLDDAVLDSSTGLSAAGYNVKARVPSFNVALTSSPLPQLKLDLDYGFRRYDKSVDTASAIITTDQDYSENKFSANAVYSFGGGYSARVYGKYLDRDDEQVVENVRTYTGGMALRKRMSNTLSGSLGLEVSGQSAKNYIDAEDVTRESTPWDRLGYDQTAFKLNLTSSLIDSVTVSLLGSWYLKSFDAPENPTVTYAMTSAHGTTVGVDVDWAPSRDWNLFGFYSFDRMKAEIDANGGDLNDTMTSHTVGAGFGLHPVNAPWTFAMRYVYGFDKDKNAAKGLMDWKNEYKSHYAQADFGWKLTQQWKLEGAALFGKVDSNDIRHLGSDAQSGSELTSGLYASPNYTACAFYVGATYYLP